MKSLNNWPVIRSANDPRLRAIKVPGTKRTVRLRSGVAPVFAAYLADWHREMPDRLNLNVGPLDSWVYREARSSDGFSNHASGTAIDARYDILRPDGKRHMTAREMKILDGILSQYKTADGHRIFANGEWWNHADGMHTELAQGWDRGAKRDTTFKDVKEVQKLLNIDNNGIRNV